MALFQDEIAAHWRSHHLALASETHVMTGIHYRLLIDGEAVAETRNLFQRPGRFEVRHTLVADGDEHELIGHVRQGILRATLTLSVDGEPLDVEPPTSEQRTKARRGRRIRIGIVTMVLAVVLLCAPAVFPTRLDAVAAQWTPTSQDAGRMRATCDTLATRAGCDPVTVTGRRDEPITFASRQPDRGLPELKGTLSLPVGPAPPHPTVLFIGGSGGTARDPSLEGGLVVHHEPFRTYEAITELLVSQGLAVLRYDKRTCRSCYPDFEPDLRRFRFAHFEDDARDAYAWLKERVDVDPNNLVIMGHSQGGAIAARLGNELEGLAAVVMLAGSIHPFREGLSGQLRRIADLRADQLDLINAWVVRRSADAFDACLAEAAKTPDEPKACLHNVSFRAFHEEATRAATTLPSILALEVPFFAMQGQLDRNIDPQSTQTLLGALADRDAEIHVVAGVGHSLVHEADRDAPRLSPELAEKLSGFLASVARHSDRHQVR